MTETVVHVTTLEEWKSVLDVWFKQGYEWNSGDKEYYGEYFKDGIRELLLNKDNDILIPTPEKREPISYKEFMVQQKEDNKMETYYVTQEQLDLINDMKDKVYPLHELLTNSYRFKNINHGLSGKGEKALLRYLGGDETIEFKLKEQLYRLWRIDDDGDKVYMHFNLGTPSYCVSSKFAFTAPLEEIKKHKTISWEIEEVN